MSEIYRGPEGDDLDREMLTSVEIKQKIESYRGEYGNEIIDGALETIDGFMHYGNIEGVKTYFQCFEAVRKIGPNAVRGYVMDKLGKCEI